MENAESSHTIVRIVNLYNPYWKQHDGPTHNYIYNCYKFQECIFLVYICSKQSLCHFRVHWNLIHNSQWMIPTIVSMNWEAYKNVVSTASDPFVETKEQNPINF